MKTCKLHSIETFVTVDGPGIRFIMFLQGCPLKCKYCHNRDTWEMKNFSEELTSDQLIKKINHSKPYFKTSNGGVTVSGGEPLMQADFLIELFQNRILHLLLQHLAKSFPWQLQFHLVLKG